MSHSTKNTTDGKCNPLFCIAALLLLIEVGHADEVRTEFSGDAGGWLVADIDQTLFSVDSTFPPTYLSTGGNPDGHISQLDPSGLAYTFAAPAGYLGNKEAYYRGTLNYDLKNNEGDGVTESWLVMLTGDQKTIIFNGVGPTAEWTKYAITLSEVGWTFPSGIAVTPQTMRQILANLTGIYILADWGWADTGFLDNVVLSTEAPVDPPSAEIAMYAGIKVTGTVGGLYRIEYSEAMQPETWIPLVTLSLPWSPYIYFDKDSINAPKRFYRVTTAP